MKSPAIAIIGAGNMGSSILAGLIKNGHPPHQIWASNPSEEKRLDLQKKFGIHTTPDNEKAIEEAEVVIFAVKPLVLKKVLSELRTSLSSRKPLIISVAAGIREQSIAKWLGDKSFAIVRAMPNTPALLGCGASALYANTSVSEAERNLAETLLASIGVTVWLAKEELMDTVTALSGCGPAYFFLIMEALQQAAEKLGLESTTARLLTLHTAFGAARMAIESGQSLTDLRHQVTSKGGTTEKAIAVLEENDIRRLLHTALKAAKLRSEELAKLADK